MFSYSLSSLFPPSFHHCILQIIVILLRGGCPYSVISARLSLICSICQLPELFRYLLRSFLPVILAKVTHCVYSFSHFDPFINSFSMFFHYNVILTSLFMYIPIFLSLLYSSLSISTIAFFIFSCCLSQNIYLNYTVLPYLIISSHSPYFFYLYSQELLSNPSFFFDVYIFFLAR